MSKAFDDWWEPIGNEVVSETGISVLADGAKNVAQSGWNAALDALADLPVKWKQTNDYGIWVEKPGIDTCADNLRFRIAELRNERANMDHSITHELCEVCASTHIGSLLEYPHNADYAPIARALAQCFNLLFDRLEKPRNES